VLEIGDDNVFREGVNIHRGTLKDQGRTVIGSHGLFMPYVHVAHDCVIGDYVVLANYAAVSGHVRVGDHANFGGYAGVAQFRSIGAHTHVAAMSLVIKDVPDYVTAGGNPAGAIGLNIEGMRRRGYAPELIERLQRAYRIVYRSGLTVKEACAAARTAGGRRAGGRRLPGVGARFALGHRATARQTWTIRRRLSRPSPAQLSITQTGITQTGIARQPGR
jgi:UDP-N-acetylglucosamine acyltransferase